MLEEPASDDVTSGVIDYIRDDRGGRLRIIINAGRSLNFGSQVGQRGVDMNPQGSIPDCFLNLCVDEHNTIYVSLSELRVNPFPLYSHLSFTIIRSKDGICVLSVRGVIRNLYDRLKHQLSYLASERVRLTRDVGPLKIVEAGAEMMLSIYTSSRLFLEIVCYCNSALQVEGVGVPEPRRALLSPTLLGRFPKSKRVSEETSRKYHLWNAIKPAEWTDFTTNTLREKIQSMAERRPYYKTDKHYSFNRGDW